MNAVTPDIPSVVSDGPNFTPLIPDRSNGSDLGTTQHPPRENYCMLYGCEMHESPYMWGMAGGGAFYPESVGHVLRRFDFDFCRLLR